MIQDCDIITPLKFTRHELSAIANLWPTKIWFGDSFTVENLESNLQQNDFQIIHLSTHSSFRFDDADKTYIQFYNNRINIAESENINWGNPPPEFIVLNASKSMFFATPLIRTGVKSVLGSYWAVEEGGSLILMIEFYRQLKTAPTKLEALRRTQVAMLKGQIHPDDLPEELTTSEQFEQLHHPYYWSAFTIIGNP